LERDEKIATRVRGSGAARCHLDEKTSEIAMRTKLEIDATRKLAGEGFKGPWPPLIKMDEATRQKIDALFIK
jgi:3-polyprenyl-4-hydroxybenzoate decarboxylase